MNQPPLLLRVFALLINGSIWLTYFFFTLFLDKLFFLAIFVWLILYAGFFIVTNEARSYLRHHNNQPRWLAIIPWITVSVTILAFTTPLLFYIDFIPHRRDFHTVAGLVEQHALAVSSQRDDLLLMDLPDAYRSLSRGDSVLAKTTGATTIIEFTRMSAIWTSSKIVYVSNDHPPRECLGGWRADANRLEVHWFWVDCSAE